MTFSETVKKTKKRKTNENYLIQEHDEFFPSLSPSTNCNFDNASFFEIHLPRIKQAL